MSTILQDPTRTQDRERFEALQRVITSQTFSKSPRLCAFLSYIVEKSIAGDVPSLSEQQIGIHVFNRPPGYNSNDDNIVRGTARSLRQRLMTYYLTEGIHDDIRIEIPKGAYVAQFQEGPATGSREIEVDAEEAAPDLPAEFHANPPLPVAASPSRLPRIPLLSGWIAAGVFALLAAWTPVHGYWLRTHGEGAPLWNTLFTRDRTTFIVTGDAGLNMYEVLQKRVVDLNSYSQQNYQLAPSAGGTLADSLGARFYTTMSDLQLVSRFIRLPQASQAAQVDVRFARDLAGSDIKHSNLILMGTRSYNPWGELFLSGQTLRLEWDAVNDEFTVTNTAPKANEQREYHWSLKKNGTNGGLTVISLADNTQGDGRVLLIQGTTMNGVYAAADYLQNEDLLNPFLASARRPDGSLRNFDLLLQSDFMREGVNNLRVIAAHIH